MDLTPYFSVTLIPGKTYLHVEATYKYFDGGYKYYTVNEPKSVGKYIETQRYGSGDGGSAIAKFEKDGQVIEVHYSYEGNTFFIEESI